MGRLAASESQVGNFAENRRASRGGVWRLRMVCGLANIAARHLLTIPRLAVQLVLGASPTPPLSPLLVSHKGIPDHKLSDRGGRSRRCLIHLNPETLLPQ